MLPLFSSYHLKGIPVKNRVIMPPMVCFGYSGENGFVTRKHLDHYHERAEGGAGIIVTEATCVLREGRLAPCQLGIWSDDHIEGLSQIPEIVKAAGVVSLIQLHHAGLVAPDSVTVAPVGPSADPKNPRSRALHLEEILTIRDAFIRAAVRAKEAGYDGVQVHGAHGYLLSQFASAFYNHRGDEYGKDTEGRMKLACEIIAGIRKQCGNSFLIDFRMGANSPTLEEGIAVAQILAKQPVDLLNVSHGGSLVTLPRPPKGFDYNWICYSGTAIRAYVSIPVAVVNEIRTPDRANYLIEQNLADFVNLGRPLLADPHWVKKAQHHEEMIVPCQNCKPRCKWYTNPEQCPAFLIRTGKEAYH
jgi:2,4-dienoyl-CoA reductase-like NADH-dependent reductase (Old Yellow Enzyme family)